MSAFLPVFDYGDGGDSDGDEQPGTLAEEEAVGGADESDLLGEEELTAEETIGGAGRKDKHDDDEETLPLGRKAALECVMELVEGDDLSPERVKSLVATLGKEDMESMAEERALSGKCGNPLCSNPHTHVPGKEKKRLDLRHHRAYTEFRGPSNFCSTACDATHAALLLESLELRQQRRYQHQEGQQQPRSILKKAPQPPTSTATATASTAAPEIKRVTKEQIMAPGIMERTAEEVAEAAAKGMLLCLKNEAKAGAQEPPPRSSGSIEGYVPKAWRAEDGTSGRKEKKEKKKDRGAAAAAADAAADARAASADDGTAAAAGVSGGAGNAKGKGAEGNGASEEKEVAERGGVCGIGGGGSGSGSGPKLERKCSHGRRVSWSDDADAISTSGAAAAAERPPRPPPHCPPPRDQQQRHEGGAAEEPGPLEATRGSRYGAPPPGMFSGISSSRGSGGEASMNEPPTTSGRGLSFASCDRVEYGDQGEGEGEPVPQSNGGAPGPPAPAPAAGAAAASSAAPSGKGGDKSKAPAARRFKPNVPPSGGGRRRPVRPINVKQGTLCAPSPAAPEGDGGASNGDKEVEDEDIQALLDSLSDGDDDLDLDGGIFSPVTARPELSSFGVMHTTICGWVTAASQRFLAAEQPPEDLQAAPGWAGVRESLRVQLSRQVGSVLQALLPPGASQQQQQQGSGISRHGIEARVDELLDTFYTCDPLPAFRVKDWRLLTAIILKALSHRRVPAAAALFSLEDDGSTQALQRFVLACESGLEEFELLHELVYPY